VFARPPKDTDILMDLRNRMSSRVDIRGARADHYFLEDSRGIRFADFHNDEDQRAYLLRPLSAGRLYVRRASDESEFVIPSSPQVVALADLHIEEPRMRTRGAANDAFESLFALPFDQKVVDSFRFGAPPRSDDKSAEPARPNIRPYAGVGLLSIGALSVAAGVYSLESARSLGELPKDVNGQTTADTNRRIQARNVAAVVGLSAGGAALAAGLLVLLWPDGHTTVAMDPSTRSATLGVHGNF
jgi:hypothetical protein